MLDLKKMIDEFFVEVSTSDLDDIENKRYKEAK